MARIRSIKPEFPHSETVGKLSRDGRLLFIQLWTIADDEGRSRASSRMLASLLYPYDDDARELIDGWLDELEQNGCIRRYEVDGTKYLEIVKWLKHQRIDHPSKSRLPEFRETLAKPREALAPDLGPRTKDKDLGKKESSSVADATRRIDDWPPEYQTIFWKAYPRRVGKQGALRELERVRKRGIPWQILMSAVAAYSATADPKFTKHPQTWLSKGCWDDEPDARKPHATSQPNGLARALDQLRHHVAEADRGEEGSDPPVRLLSNG